MCTKFGGGKDKTQKKKVEGVSIIQNTNKWNQELYNDDNE